MHVKKSKNHIILIQLLPVKLNRESKLIIILGITFRILCGLLFLFSAYLKLFPIEFFEYQLVSDHLATWGSAGYLSRLLIGLEFFLGIGLLLNFDKKQLIVKTALALTLFFTIYLFAVLIFKGNEPNCNCFGEYIPMSVAESIFKNIILISILFFILKFHNGYSFKFPKVIITVLLLGSYITVFVVNPINKVFADAANQDEVGFKIDLSYLYTDSIYNKPNENLIQGKHIIACLSLSCPHCRLAALKFGIMKRTNPQLPVYFVLNGDSAKLKRFYEDTRSENISSNIVKGSRFIVLSGLKLPAIYMVNNSIVERRIQYTDVTDKDIMDWVKSKN